MSSQCFAANNYRLLFLQLALAENANHFMGDPLSNSDKLTRQKSLIKQAKASINKTQASLPVSSNSSLAVPVQSAVQQVEVYNFCVCDVTVCWIE